MHDDYFYLVVFEYLKSGPHNIILKNQHPVLWISDLIQKNPYASYTLLFYDQIEQDVADRARIVRA